MRPRLLALLAFTLSCTDVGLFAVSGLGAEGPDPVAFEGEACLPMAVGNAFPVKILFVGPGGPGVTPEITGAIVDSLNSVTVRLAQPYNSFALAGYHTLGTTFQAAFADAATIQMSPIPLF